MFQTIKRSLIDEGIIKLDAVSMLKEMVPDLKEDFLKLEQDGDNVSPKNLYTLGLLLGYKFPTYIEKMSAVPLPNDENMLLYYNGPLNYGICHKDEYNNTLK